MILITVGSTHFDELIKTIDQLVADKIIIDDVVCQIGNGKYEPEFCKFFKFKDGLDKDIQDANLIISHGGATILQLLKMEKPFIAIANTELQDDHQTIFLRQLAKYYDISWTNQVTKIENLLSTPHSNECKLSIKEDLAKNISMYCSDK